MRITMRTFIVIWLLIWMMPVSMAAFAVCQDPTLTRMEADYILACQYINRRDPASGAINNVYGTPTWVVPRENALAILGLLQASECLNLALYRNRAQQAMKYLLKIQDADGGWFDQYSYDQPVLRSKSPTQTAEVMIAMNKLGFKRSHYFAMVKGAEFLIRLQDPANKTGQDDGLITGGLDEQGQYRTWRWTSDNAFGYQAFKAASRWARILRDKKRQLRYEDAAARVLDGINTVLKDPNSPVWHRVVDAQGNPNPDNEPHEWINYAPQMLDLPAEGVGNPEVGDWIYQTLVHQPEGGVVWNDGWGSNRLSPGFSFQASLVWIDTNQTAYKDSAWQWANSSGLHQITPDDNGVIGGWIDWKETTGNHASWWERFIDTSFYSIAVREGGFNFSAEP